MTAAVMNDAALAFDADSHVYTLRERQLPSVTQILAAAGVADFSAPHFTDAVKERGSLVHRMIALDVEEVLDESSVDDALQPYLEGWRRFLRDTRAAIEWWERPVCDPFLGYAGTLDGIVWLPGVSRRTVIDVKRALYPSAGPQTAAYLRCARALYPDFTTFNRAALVLSGDGGYTLQPLTDASDEMTFLAALRIYYWRAGHLKGGQ